MASGGIPQGADPVDHRTVEAEQIGRDEEQPAAARVLHEEELQEKGRQPLIGQAGRFGGEPLERYGPAGHTARGDVDRPVRRPVRRGRFEPLP